MNGVLKGASKGQEAAARFLSREGPLELARLERLCCCSQGTTVHDDGETTHHVVRPLDSARQRFRGPGGRCDTAGRGDP